MWTWIWSYRPVLTPTTMKASPTSSTIQPAARGTQRRLGQRAFCRSARGRWSGAAVSRCSLPDSGSAGPGPLRSVISDM